MTDVFYIQPWFLDKTEPELTFLEENNLQEALPHVL